MAWTVETLDKRVDEEILDFSEKLQARLVHTIGLIESVGLQNVREPHVKHIEGKLWEIRVNAKNSWGRALYVTVKGQKIIILNAFEKKSNKTPKREITTAIERAKKSGLIK